MILNIDLLTQKQLGVQHAFHEEYLQELQKASLRAEAIVGTLGVE